MKANVGMLVLALGSWSGSVALAQTPVDLSVHNLSAQGPTDRTYASTDKNTAACIFCHAPHKTIGKTPIWNKQLPTTEPTTYTSTTYVQPTSPVSERSKLCLSCHDGSIALGQTVATGNLGLSSKMSGHALLGTDLRRDHPISFPLPARDDGEIAGWLRTAPVVSPDTAIKTYESKIECRTCHDPHVPDYDTQVKKFLVRSNESGAICTTCHDVNRGTMTGYFQSAHALATQNAVSTGSGFPYGTVAKNSCVICHKSHNAANSGALLMRSSEETACLPCHGSPSAAVPAAPNVMGALATAPYVHPITRVSGAHDPAEVLPLSGTRHSECQDCHNPHSAQPSNANTLAPAVPGALLGVTGVSATGAPMSAPAVSEYQICFKCHAGSSNKPQSSSFADYDRVGGRTPFRQSQAVVPAADQYNTAKEFAAGSSHNVVGVAGRRPPSLRAAIIDLNGTDTLRKLDGSTALYCGDCHNSDTARDQGKNGANGVHSSQYPHLLERRYDINTAAGGLTNRIQYGTGLNAPYALCDKCHDVDGLVSGSNDTLFRQHNRHVAIGGVSCASCHAPHGVQTSDTAHHGGLIDVDLAVATKTDGTPLSMPDTVGTDSGINTQQRSCALVCHSHRHSVNPTTY